MKIIKALIILFQLGGCDQRVIITPEYNFWEELSPKKESFYKYVIVDKVNKEFIYAKSRFDCSTKSEIDISDTDYCKKWSANLQSEIFYDKFRSNIEHNNWNGEILKKVSKGVWRTENSSNSILKGEFSHNESLTFCDVPLLDKYLSDDFEKKNSFLNFDCDALTQFRWLVKEEINYPPDTVIVNYEIKEIFESEIPVDILKKIEKIKLAKVIDNDLFFEN